MMGTLERHEDREVDTLPLLFYGVILNYTVHILLYLINYN